MKVATSVLTAVAAGGLLLSSGPALAAGSADGPAGGRSTAYGFDQPVAAALAGGDVFVANKAGNSVTEVDGSTGAHVATIRSSADHFDGPSAIVAAGKNLFVANAKGSSVTEVKESGAFVRLVRGSAAGFTDPVALAASGAAVFVLSGAGGVVKLDTDTGAVLGKSSGKSFGFDKPTAVAEVDGHLFVANSGGDSVTEIDSATMRLVQVLSAAKYGFETPTGMAAHGADLFVTNQTGETVTELSASGGLVQVVPDTSGYLPTPEAVTAGDGYVFVASPPGGSPMITQVVPDKPATLPWMMCNTNGPYTFSNPQALVVDGTHLWVVNEGGAGGPTGNSLTEMDAGSGALVHVFG